MGYPIKEGGNNGSKSSGREDNSNILKPDIRTGARIINAMVDIMISAYSQEGYRQQKSLIMGMEDGPTREAMLEELDREFGIPTQEEKDRMAAELLAKEAPGSEVSIIGLAGSVIRIRDKMVERHLDRSEADELVLAAFPSVCRLDRHVADKDLATQQSMIDINLSILVMSLGSKNRYQEDPRSRQS